MVKHWKIHFHPCISSAFLGAFKKWCTGRAVDEPVSKTMLEIHEAPGYPPEIWDLGTALEFKSINTVSSCAVSL